MTMVRTIGIVLAGAAAGVLAACGSSSATTPTPTASTPTQTATAPVTTPSPAPATIDLSGTWKGQYSGPFNGTFTLNWTQTSGALKGTIVLSSPADNLPINGTVTGSSISFGAVGVVTYTGTVSGNNSMSGSYIDVANGQTGSWSGSKQ